MAFDLDEFFHDGISTLFCGRFRKPATHKVLREIPNVLLADDRLYFYHVLRHLKHLPKVFPVKDSLWSMRYPMFVDGA